jgi:hypothetical protein
MDVLSIRDKKLITVAIAHGADDATAQSKTEKKIVR